MKNFYWIRIAAFGACLIPFGQLLYNAYQGDLGANPIETITRFTGSWALIILFASLSITPLRRLTGWTDLIKFRRMLGLFAFFYALLHFINFIGIDYSLNLALIREDLFEKRYAIVGFVSFVLLLPLAITSIDRLRQRLDKNWKILHRLVYLAGDLEVVHYIWQSKAEIRLPIIHG